MDLKKYFLTILKSINPYSYDELVDRGFSDAIKYLFFIMIFATIISLVLFVPKLFMMSEDISLAYNNFDTLTVTKDYSFNESFIFSNDPMIRFDHNNSMGDEAILVTDDSINYRKFLLFGPEKSMEIKKSIDLKSDNEFTEKVILFLIPSLIFWGFLFFTAYFLIIIGLMILLGIMFLWIVRINIKILRVIKIAIYSSTLLICLQLFLLPFYRVVYVPIITYLILFLIVLFVFKEEESVQGSGKNNYSNKKNIFSDNNKDTFSKKKSSQFKSVQNDNFDVDERGNLKSSSKKKKSFEDENDGYVMLK